MTKTTTNMFFDSVEGEGFDEKEAGMCLEGTIEDIRGPTNGRYEIIVRKADGTLGSVVLSEKDFAVFEMRMRGEHDA